MEKITAEHAEILCKNILIIYKQEACGACDRVVSEIEKQNLSYVKQNRDEVTETHFTPNQLIIVVGGDGTILRMAHYMKHSSYLLTVNSAPGRTEGFLTRTSCNEFAEFFTQFKAGELHFTKYPTLSISVNGEKLPRTALNEISISALKPYLMFVFERNGVIQKSSGILTATPLGSTAWALSAGGDSMPIKTNKNIKEFQFVIREPYHGNIYTVPEVKGIVETFKCTSLSEGMIVFDSIDKEFKIHPHDTLTVEFADTSVAIIEK
ncbi:MAG: NAD(+)/NADH kinase [Candidatus Woesearchaeota archaeon]